MPALNASPASVTQQRITSGKYQGVVLGGYTPTRPDLLPFYGFSNPWTAFTDTIFDTQPTTTGKQFFRATPAVGARIIRVSNSGNDANTGYIVYDGNSPTLTTIAAPKATLASAWSVFRAGDILLLECGSVFREAPGQIPSGTNSTTGMTVIGFYGDAAQGRPCMEWIGSSFFGNSGYNGGLQNIAISGLEFRNYTHPEKILGFTGDKDDSPNLNFFAITNLRLDDLFLNEVEIAIQKDVSANRCANVKITNNISTGHYANTSSNHQLGRPSDYFIADTDNLEIRGCVSDCGGWSKLVKDAAGNQYNHGWYLQYSNGNDVIFEDNLCTNSSSHGVQLRSGGYCAYNFFGRPAIGIDFGYSPNPMPSGYTGLAEFNVVSELETMYKGSSPSKGQDLATNAVWGLQTAPSQTATFEFRDNVVAHVYDNPDPIWQRRWTSLFTKAEQYQSTTTSLRNLLYKVDDLTQGTSAGYPDAERVRLSEYHKEIVGATGSFEGYVQTHLDRPLRGTSTDFAIKTTLVPWMFARMGVTI